MRQETGIQKLSGVTIRKLVEADMPAIVRLVQLDSAELPKGDLLGAEVESKLVAVVPIEGGGDAVADPFSRTAELRALLKLRAAQLRGREPEQRRRFGGFLGGRRTRAPLPSSPPGAGGRLLSLPVRPL